jgi:hypothetical protein
MPRLRGVSTSWLVLSEADAPEAPLPPPPAPPVLPTVYQIVFMFMSCAFAMSSLQTALLASGTPIDVRDKVRLCRLPPSRFAQYSSIPTSLGCRTGLRRCIGVA